MQVQTTCFPLTPSPPPPGLEDWFPTWSRKGWRTASGEPVKNAPLIRYVHARLEHRTASGQRVVLEHVRGHSGIVGNDAADNLASEGASMPEVDECDWDKLRRALKSPVDGDDDDGGSSRDIKIGERSWGVPVEGKANRKAELTYEIDFGDGAELKNVRIVGTKIIVQTAPFARDPPSTLKVRMQEKSLHATVNPSQVDFDVRGWLKNLSLFRLTDQPLRSAIQRRRRPTIGRRGTGQGSAWLIRDDDVTDPLCPVAIRHLCSIYLLFAPPQ